MGAKTPEDERQDSPANDAIAGPNPPKSAVAGGLLVGVLQDAEDEDGDDDDDEGEEDKMGADLKSESQPSKKKRKRNKKKKKKPAGPSQSTPPRIPLSDLFRDKPYPEGQLVDYDRDMNLERTTAEELRHLSTLAEMDDDFLRDYRKAAEVHRQVRAHAQAIARPGVSMTELALEIEEGVRALTGHQGVEPGDPLRAGMAFPTGLCLNNVAAHWTPNAGGREVILDKDDVLSVDFGVHVNGRIVDSAFTVAFNPVYDNLLASVKAATNKGLKEAGIDARMDHISAEIQEVMESYEITLNGQTTPIRPTRNISDHNILRYRIHGDKQVPFAKSTSTQRMEEGDVFAIETFGTTGRGWLRDDVGIYGYGRNEGVNSSGLRHPGARALLKRIEESFGPLVFAKRYLERTGVRNYLPAMRALVAGGIVEAYGPLVDVPGSYVAQFEHTVLLKPNCKEVISRGDDY